MLTGANLFRVRSRSLSPLPRLHDEVRVLCLTVDADAATEVAAELRQRGVRAGA
jgi:hypothetical protein